jgi:hypothetical protein
MWSWLCSQCHTSPGITVALGYLLAINLYSVLSLSKTVNRPALAHLPLFTAVQQIAFHTTPDATPRWGLQIAQFYSRRLIELSKSLSRQTISSLGRDA